MFRKDGDFATFEKVRHEALQLYQIELYAYQLMTTHWHLVIRPLIDGEMGRFYKWVCGPHTMRYNAHYHTAGKGHLYQGRFKSFPIQNDEHFFVACRYVERNALRAGIVSRAEDWRWGLLWRRQQSPEPEPKLLSRWPLSRLPSWVARVNEPLTDRELKTIRNCTQRGAPLGDEGLGRVDRAATGPRINNASPRSSQSPPNAKWKPKKRFDPFVF